MWKNEKFTLTEKLFREIKSSVLTLLSRIFCHKSLRMNIRDFYNVPNTVWNLGIFLQLRFYVKSSLDRAHSVEKYTKILSRRKNFRQTTYQKSAKSIFTNWWFSTHRGISRFFTLNEFCSILSILEFIVNNYFLN